MTVILLKCHYDVCQNAENKVIMLNFIILNAIVLTVIILDFIMLNDIMSLSCFFI
jgi:hypothetical protein